MGLLARDWMFLVSLKGFTVLMMRRVVVVGGFDAGFTSATDYLTF